MSDNAKKIIKIVLIVVAALSFVGIVFHFIMGISLSLHDDDIKTAQNRINSSYQFLMMLAAGALTVISLFGVFAIKVRVLPACIGKFFGLDSEEAPLEVEPTETAPVEEKAEEEPTETAPVEEKVEEVENKEE